MKRTPLQRRTPLRSKPRQHQPAVEREPKPMARVATLHRGTYAGSTTAAAPKRTYVRSPALLAAVRQLPCMHTGKVGETEPAHSNWPQHGKAGAIKADDNRVAALCRDVHRELDQGKNWTAEQRQALWWEAHKRTVRELQRQGMWPAGVPVPQLEDFWA